MASKVVRVGSTRQRTAAAVSAAALAAGAGFAVATTSRDNGSVASGPTSPTSPTSSARPGLDADEAQRVDVRYRIVAEPVVTGSDRYGYQAAVRLDRRLPRPTGGARERERYTLAVNGDTSLAMKPYAGRAPESACYRATFEDGPIYTIKPGQRVAVTVVDFGPDAGFRTTRITRPRVTVLRRVDEQSRSGARLRKRLVDRMGCAGLPPRRSGTG